MGGSPFRIAFNPDGSLPAVGRDAPVIFSTGILLSLPGAKHRWLNGAPGLCLVKGGRNSMRPGTSGEKRKPSF